MLTIKFKEIKMQVNKLIIILLFSFNIKSQEFSKKQHALVMHSPKSALKKPKFQNYIEEQPKTKITKKSFVKKTELGTKLRVGFYKVDYKTSNIINCYRIFEFPESYTIYQVKKWLYNKFGFKGNIYGQIFNGNNFPNRELKNNELIVNLKPQPFVDYREINFIFTSKN